LIRIALFIRRNRFRFERTLTKAILAVGAGRWEATLAAFWLLAQSLSAAGVPLTDIHIRDPFILPLEQATNYYLVASGGRSVTVRSSDDLKTWGEAKLYSHPGEFWQ